MEISWKNSLNVPMQQFTKRQNAAEIFERKSSYAEKHELNLESPILQIFKAAMKLPKKSLVGG